MRRLQYLLSHWPYVDVWTLYSSLNAHDLVTVRRVDEAKRVKCACYANKSDEVTGISTDKNAPKSGTKEQVNSAPCLDMRSSAFNVNHPVTQERLNADTRPAPLNERDIILYSQRLSELIDDVGDMARRLDAYAVTISDSIAEEIIEALQQQGFCFLKADSKLVEFIDDLYEDFPGFVTSLQSIQRELTFLVDKFRDCSHSSFQSDPITEDREDSTPQVSSDLHHQFAVGRRLLEAQQRKHASLRTHASDEVAEKSESHE